jgi:hypothetical protein
MAGSTAVDSTSSSGSTAVGSMISSGGTGQAVQGRTIVPSWEEFCAAVASVASRAFEFKVSCLNHMHW